ncbi:MAG: HlyC/CorC family transporter [Lewinellaceae bacterium]|nr:HlyC/CorC family transporter [Lewinellaceae bacterium]
MEITIVLLLIVLHGFFVLGKSALITAKRAKLESEKAAGSRSAATAVALLDNSDMFLLAMQIGITLLSIVEGTYAGLKLGGWAIPLVADVPSLAPYAGSISLVLVISLIACLALVVGELAPKYIAVQHSESITLAFAPFLNFFAQVLRPFARFLNWITRIFLRMFLIKPGGEQHISEEEIKHMVKKANQQGVLEQKESEFIQNILRFADRDAYTIMTHRNDLEWLDVHAPMEENDRIIRESGFTKFLVCDDSIENILGVLKLRDYIDSCHKPDFDLRGILAPPLYVPETMNALKILERFRNERNYFAVVVDEYGSIQGIITLHDLTENIFGALPDVDDIEYPAIVTREDGSLLVEGGIPIDEMRDTVDIKEFDLHDADYATLAGYILHKLGEIPSAGDYFESEGYRFEIVDMDKSKIDKVLISRLVLSDEQ